MGPILEKALSNLFVRYSVLKAHALFKETVYLSINLLWRTYAFLWLYRAGLL